MGNTFIVETLFKAELDKELLASEHHCLCFIAFKQEQSHIVYAQRQFMFYYSTILPNLQNLHTERAQLCALTALLRLPIILNYVQSIALLQ